MYVTPLEDTAIAKYVEDTAIAKYVEALLSWSTGSTSSTEEGPGDSISKSVDVETVILTQGPSDVTTHWLP